MTPEVLPPTTPAAKKALSLPLSAVEWNLFAGPAQEQRALPTQIRPTHKQRHNTYALDKAKRKLIALNTNESRRKPPSVLTLEKNYF